MCFATSHVGAGGATIPPGDVVAFDVQLKRPRKFGAMKLQAQAQPACRSRLIEPAECLPAAGRMRRRGKEVTDHADGDVVSRLKDNYAFISMMVTSLLGTQLQVYGPLLRMTSPI